MSNMHHAHSIRKDIYVCKKTHGQVCLICVEEAEKENPPFNLLPTRGPGLFSHNVPLAVCPTRRALSSTGATCSEENTSGIDKNCLFFPRCRFLVNPWPLLSHVRPAGRIDLRHLEYLHCADLLLHSRSIRAA